MYYTVHQYIITKVYVPCSTTLETLHPSPEMPLCLSDSKMSSSLFTRSETVTVNPCQTPYLGYSCYNNCCACQWVAVSHSCTLSQSHKTCVYWQIFCTSPIYNTVLFVGFIASTLETNSVARFGCQARDLKTRCLFQFLLSNLWSGWPFPVFYRAIFNDQGCVHSFNLLRWSTKRLFYISNLCPSAL